MNAMIFAAGLGTRLKPLTDTVPKALVRVLDKPLLQYVLDKLHKEGFDNIVVNVHHFANQIIDYLGGTDVKISDETAQLLDTGGGLKKAFPLFGNNEHILIHNVDILSNVKLAEFYNESLANDATLLVSWRETKRYLLFNEEMYLVGWTNIETGEVKSPYDDLDPQTCKMYAFSGIHCISPFISTLMEKWPDRFSIMDFYIKSCRDLKIKAIVKVDLLLMDVGKLDTIKQTETFIQQL